MQAADFEPPVSARHMPAIEQGMSYMGACTCLATPPQLQLNGHPEHPPVQPTEALNSVLASQLQGIQRTLGPHKTQRSGVTGVCSMP